MSRKFLILVSSFVVSTMIIYSVYYYSSLGRQERGIVAAAQDLPHTLIGFSAHEGVNKNLIYSLGLFQALQRTPADPNAAALRAMSDLQRLPDANYVGFDSTFSANGMEQLYRRVLIRFEKHPPIDFGPLNEGDSILFSYFFRNLTLPRGYRRASEGVTFGGQACDAMEYYPFNEANTSKETHLYLGSGDSKVLRIDIPGGKDEAIWINGATDNYLANDIKRADALMAEPGREHTVSSKEVLLIPSLDFSVVKRYRGDSIPGFGRTFSGYKIIEERYKVKTSHRQELNKRIKHAADMKRYVFQGNCLFLLRRKGDPLPYFMVRMSHPELLVPFKP